MPTDPPITARLHDPGDLIAALPVLLGFYPNQSLVAVHLRNDRIVLVARYDIDRLAIHEQIDNVIIPTSYVPTESIHLVVIAADVNNSPGELVPHAATVAAVRDRLCQAGIDAPHDVWVAAIRAEATWRCYSHPGCHGRLPDPRSTTLAAAATYAGQVIHPSRQAVADQITPDAHTILARRATLIATRGGRALDVRQGLRTVRSAIDAASHGLLPTSDEQIAELAVALTRPRIRDACFAYALDTHAGAAERLWTALVRATPPPHRAEPAALLAVTAYLRGNGALAILALHAATQAQPGHALTRLVRLAITTGLAPDDIRDAITRTVASKPIRPDTRAGTD